MTQYACIPINAVHVIAGEVYNVGPYMQYHPGGIEELMRAAGTDGTQAYNDVRFDWLINQSNQIHPWVNYASLLASCHVGKYIGSLADC